MIKMQMSGILSRNIWFLNVSQNHSPLYSKGKTMCSAETHQNRDKHADIPSPASLKNQKQITLNSLKRDIAYKSKQGTELFSLIGRDSSKTCRQWAKWNTWKDSINIKTFQSFVNTFSLLLTGVHIRSYLLMLLGRSSQRLIYYCIYPTDRVASAVSLAPSSLQSSTAEA